MRDAASVQQNGGKFLSNYECTHISTENHSNYEMTTLRGFRLKKERKKKKNSLFCVEMHTLGNYNVQGHYQSEVSV